MSVHHVQLPGDREKRYFKEFLKCYTVGTEADGKFWVKI